MALVNPPVARFSGLPDVLAAMQAHAAADPQCAVVSTDGLTKNKDNLHYDAAGQLALGSRLAEAWLAQQKSGQKR